MKVTIRSATVSLFLLFALPAFCQDKPTFHVTSIHQETPDDHGTADKGSMARYLKMIGTFEGKTYTAEALDAGWTEALEVGRDYPAAHKKDVLIIESTFKGRAEKIQWHILTVEKLNTHCCTDCPEKSETKAVEVAA